MSQIQHYWADLALLGYPRLLVEVRGVWRERDMGDDSGVQDLGRGGGGGVLV